MSLRIGTRASALATTQTGHVADALRAAGHEVELVLISTTGDRVQGTLTPSLGAGVFTSALEQALLDDRIDLAVHSYKDLPTKLADGLALTAVTAREDPRDALVSAQAASLAELPAGARVGTSSLRRQAMLRRRFPSLEPLPLRGNVDSRLAKLDAGEYDAILLAWAGLRRLGQGERGQPVDPAALLPAPAQGALALETRADDEAARAAVAALDDPASRAACAAERALLATLEGGCLLPIGALATLDGDALTLRAELLSPDGQQAVSGETRGPLAAARPLGEALAREMLADGGAEILAAQRP